MRNASKSGFEKCVGRKEETIPDDRYLAAAPGASADCIVTNDRDLLVLNKPFGVLILTPIQFLKLVRTAG